MSKIIKNKLSNGVEIIWAVPLSGFGHVADEQPLPYLHINNNELTPRFGGEEANVESALPSLPLPFGKLSEDWPIRQKIFNASRKKVNIYWRNIFKSFCRRDRVFYFAEQLNYLSIKNGFLGESPVLSFKRTFQIKNNSIFVEDKIIFKVDIKFEEFFLCPWAEFPREKSFMVCFISSSLPVNYTKTIKSSSGQALWHANRVNDVFYKKGDIITWNYLYQVN